MTTFAFTHFPHRTSVRLLPAVPLAVAMTLLAGCGGGASTPQGPVVTVTATPTVTASGTPAPAPAPTTTKAGAPESDVVGRKFDLGTIVKVVQDGDVQVIIFDRWTARGVSDAKLAASGVPLAVHSDARYQNLNARTTFRIPVLAGAIFTYNHCVAVDQPAQQRSATLKDFAGLQKPEDVMLLSLDPKGHVFKAQNDPAC